MNAAPGPAAAALPPLRRMSRPQADRVVVGVAAGLAEHLGVPVRTVRFLFLLTSLVGGIGAAAYIMLWPLTPSSDDSAGGSSGTGGIHGRGPGTRARSAAQATQRPALRALLAGALLVVLGVTWVLDSSGVGLDIGGGTLVPLLVVGVGAVIGWSHLDDTDRRAWLGGGLIGVTAGGRALMRLGLGATLTVGGVLLLLTRGQGVSVLWDAVVATLAVLAGLVFVLAPWVMRLWTRLQEEQARTIRERERADIAAHLHDSVLQTLALIQRTDDPARVAQLARAQERELRTWLYGAPRVEDSLAAAVAAAAHEVEDLHGVPIDAVVTGDRPHDEAGEALAAALREALLNAVRHGSPPVSAYVEVGPDGVEAFVRDHGPGFELGDLDRVPEDRHGVRESICRRMERHGGTATIRRRDPGTEVTLTLPTPERSRHDEPDPAPRSADPEPGPRTGEPDADPNRDRPTTPAPETKGQPS